jgi:hypothetical protein
LAVSETVLAPVSTRKLHNAAVDLAAGNVLAVAIHANLDAGASTALGDAPVSLPIARPHFALVDAQQCVLPGDL